MILSWIFTIFAILGARETSNPRCDLLKTNALYSIANVYNIIYFAITLQYPYLILNLIFCFLSLKGLIHQIKQRRCLNGS